MQNNLNMKAAISAVAALGLVCAVQAEVVFAARTLPAAEGLSAEVKAVRAGDEWTIAVMQSSPSLPC